MFRWFVVVRLFEAGGTRRPAKEMATFEVQDATAWHFTLRDLDYDESYRGFSQPFKSEEAARRYYANYKEGDGPGTSIHLLLATAFTRRGAAKQGLQALLVPPRSTAELLDHSRRPSYEEIDQARCAEKAGAA